LTSVAGLWFSIHSALLFATAYAAYVHSTTRRRRNSTDPEQLGRFWRTNVI
jgi:hypothetical protein